MACSDAASSRISSRMRRLRSQIGPESISNDPENLRVAIRAFQMRQAALREEFGDFRVDAVGPQQMPLHNGTAAADIQPGAAVRQPQIGLAHRCSPPGGKSDLAQLGDLLGSGSAVLFPGGFVGRVSGQDGRN